MIRRLGLLPGGMPDRLGEDDELLRTGLDAEVVVHFPDPPESLYQIRHWYGPLRALHDVRKVVVVTADSRTARAVREESSLPVVVVARYATLDTLLARSAVRLVLYVNFSPDNFEMLRFADPVHVSLLHGDSDKVVSVSNQIKAFDFSFVAGRAGVDRLAANLRGFDAAARCLVVGRPQLDTGEDVGRPGPRPPSDTGRKTVLYAPTWEGGHPSAAYGSLDALGEKIAHSLLADPGLRLVYRPHPLTGVRVPEYGDADAAVRAAVTQAAERHPGAGHRVSEGRSLGADFADADVLICDVSGVAADWLAVDRPIVMTDPGHEGVAAQSALLDASTRIGTGADPRAVVHDELSADPNREQRRRLIEYYLTDITPGASIAAFLAACEQAAWSATVDERGNEASTDVRADGHLHGA